MPVVCCSLHSQVVPAAAGVGEGVRVAYVQLAGGALPVALSDSVRALKSRGLVETAIAAGASVGGDVQAVGVASALAWAAAQGFDVAICSIGPGIVGTGSPLGHGGLAAAEAANAASALGGSPVLAVRVSRAVSSRERIGRLASHACGARACDRPARGCVARRSRGAGVARRSARRWTPQVGARHARGCRSSTWAAGETTTRGSSRPRSPRAGSHGANWVRWRSAHSVR